MIIHERVNDAFFLKRFIVAKTVNTVLDHMHNFIRDQSLYQMDPHGSYSMINEWI